MQSFQKCQQKKASFMRKFLVFYTRSLSEVMSIFFRHLQKHLFRMRWSAQPDKVFLYHLSDQTVQIIATNRYSSYLFFMGILYHDKIHKIKHDFFVICYDTKPIFSLILDFIYLSDTFTIFRVKVL